MSTLTLINDTWQTITDYVRLIDAEIGMFGYVTMIDGNFYVDEVFLVQQEVSGASVDFADAGLEYAINKAIEDGRIDDLKFCCHSHVEMGAFWSATDEDMISGMNNGMTPYLVSLVINKRHETEQRVDFYNPTGPVGEFTDQLRFDLDLKVVPSTEPARKSEIDELVTRKSHTWTSGKRRGRYSNSYNSFTTAAEIPVTNAAGDIVGYVDDDRVDDLFPEPVANDPDLFGWDLKDLAELEAEYGGFTTP